MDERIKAENNVADELLNIDNNAADEQPAELTELFIQPKKHVSISEIITVQAILCVIASIAFIVLNMLKPNAAERVYDSFKAAAFEESTDNPAEEIIEAAVEFVNSKPVRYD